MRTITSKIKLIGGMLSLIIASIVGITVYINHASKQDSIVINIAGKQRMLTQQIAKEVLWLQNRNDGDFKALDAARTEFGQSLEDLMNGNSERGIYAPPKQCITERLFQVSSLWKTFDDHVVRFKGLLVETNKLKESLPSENEAILMISDQVVKQMVNDGLEGAVIDDAGRQRMLTQRIGFSATQYLITGDSHYFTQFQKAYGLYGATLKRFEDNQVWYQRPELHRLLTENDTQWQEYSTYMFELMEKQKQLNEAVLHIKELNVVLLETMDSAVEAYSTYSEDQRFFLQYFQYAASLIALIFMLYAVYLTRRIQGDFELFLDRSRSMADSLKLAEETVRYEPTMETVQTDELSQASMHMSHFVDKINTILQHAQQAIHESEQAANELATVTETMDEQFEGLGIDEASKKDIDRTIDKSEDIVIQTLEELSGTSRLLSQLQANLNSIVTKTEPKPRG